MGVLRRFDGQPIDVALPTSGIAMPTRIGQPVSARGLSMRFGGVQAVSDLHFTAPAGRITSLIGPNGAGKTTALNMLSGFYRPSAGAFALGSRELQGQGTLGIARSGIARTFQTSLLFGSLSALDNVVIGMHRGRLGPLFGAARRHDARHVARALQLLAFCGYAGRPSTPASSLPHVDRRLVEIARALAMDPDALLLDEPAAGLSLADKQRLALLLRRIADAGVTVLLVEHDMALVMGVSDQVVALDAGVPLATGAPATVQADPAVRQAYLGEAMSLRDVGARRLSRTEAPELLGVGKLVAGYGAEPVLHGIDLQVRQGEAVAVLGANGAGKSTLMRALAGLHRPVQGGVHVGGRDLAQLDAEQIVAHGIVLVPEGRQVFAELSVRDNLRLGAFLQSRRPGCVHRTTAAALPALARTPAPASRLAVGRRTADVGDRPRADEPSADPAAGRAFARPGTQGHHRVVRHPRCAAPRWHDAAAGRPDGRPCVDAGRPCLRDRGRSCRRARQLGLARDGRCAGAHLPGRCMTPHVVRAISLVVLAVC